MQNITIGQIGAFIAVLTPVIGVLFFLFKIYRKIENSDKLTKMSLKVNMIMLDHFIGKGEGNGEFKQLRKDVQDILLNQE